MKTTLVAIILAASVGNAYAGCPAVQTEGYINLSGSCAATPQADKGKATAMPLSARSNYVRPSTDRTGYDQPRMHFYYYTR